MIEANPTPTTIATIKSGAHKLVASVACAAFEAALKKCGGRRMGVRGGVVGLVAVALAFAGVGASAATAGPVVTGQEFTDSGQYAVPAGVCQVTVTARGGAGGRGYESSRSAGTGGAIEATFPVTPESTLDVFVGKKGAKSTTESGATGTGGPGYKNGGNGKSKGGGGGGASAVLDGSDVLIVAGGGGGAGTNQDGGNAGAGANNGSTGSGSGGAGGITGNAPANGVTTTRADSGGGGAGAGPGGAPGSDSRGGGGGASWAAATVLGVPSDPGSPPTNADGSVLISPADPGIGCAPVLEVAKVVSGTSGGGFTVHVSCTREVVPAAVGSAASEVTVDDDLPFAGDGSPDSANGPAGWMVANGVWVYSSVDLVGSTCTATETVSADATSVSYECAWTIGTGASGPNAGCPGESSGPGATPASVTLEGNADVGRLTVTNTFVEAPPVLEVAKVVSGTSGGGFTVHVSCTREVVPAAVGSAASEVTVDDDLPFAGDGSPDSANGPAGWMVANGVWVYSSVDLVGSTCTATETVSADATSVSYECAWTIGTGASGPNAGCPGESSGPGATPASVTLEGNADVGRLTVTNTFAKVPDAAPDAVVLQPTFTG